jgi:beta-lactamase regulating signal transducer with metallopeptidase domain
MRELLVAYLLNAAWQIPLAAIGAPLVCCFAGLTPKARNRVWLGFMLAGALAPALAFKASPVSAAAPETLQAAATLAAVEMTAAPSLLSEEWQALRGMIAAAAAHAAPVLMVLFAFTGLIVGARLITASLAARRLVRRSRPATLAGEIIAALEAFADEHGRPVLQVRCSPDVRTPAVVGALKPVILIPERLSVGREDLRAALLHEAAHVVRRDYAVNLACEVLTLPVSWHPALIALKAGVRRSRELACDAMAASAMASDQTYAKCLLSLARALGAKPPARDAALLVGLFGRTDLEDRVMHLMNPAPAARGPLHAARLCGAGAIATALLATALVLHVSPAIAQQPVVSRTDAAGPATAAPTPLAAATAAVPPTPPAPPSAKHPHRHSWVQINEKGVLINDGDGAFEHRWTAANGQTFTVNTDNAADLTPEQKRHLESVVADAEREGAEARKLTQSPEFKAKIAKAKEAGEAARKMVESPEFKAQIEKARIEAMASAKLTESPEFKAQIAKAREAGEAARKMVESPEFKAQMAQARTDAVAGARITESAEFKAQIAKAREAGDAVRKVVESSEFRAQITKARTDSEEIRRLTRSTEFRARMDAARQASEAARELTQSPEFKASIARARAAAERLQHEVDELDEQPSRATP